MRPISVDLPSSTLPAVVKRSRSLDCSVAMNASMSNWPLVDVGVFFENGERGI